MKTRKLGTNGPEISALGLGLMGMSDFYGPADEAESLAVIDAAIERGVTLLDTGDFYGSGHNEMLLARALGGSSSKREKLFIQVKFGGLRSPDGAFIGFDARPVAVKNALAQTLRRLRTDYVDLYMPARVDPAVPIEDTMGAIAECIDKGWVRHAGLSEAGAATIAKAHDVVPITALQREYSLISRDVEGDILDALRERGAGLTAYGVLSRGLLTGTIRSAADVPKDYRAHLPRFTGDNLTQNLKLVAALSELAQSRGVTPAQLAIAWVSSRGDDILPLVGVRRLARLDETLAAAEIELSDEELEMLERAVPAGAVAGERYDDFGMRLIDG
jgi:pyridoxine 4-dehydrogenase